MPRTRHVRINDRDVFTLATIGEYGVLDRALCRSLCFENYSAEWCRQVVTRLADAGLIGVTTLQVWHDEDSTRGGRIPQLLSLTKAGAEIVQVRTGQYPRRVLKSEPSPATFWHRLQVVKVRVAFDQAATAAGLTPPQWIMEQDARADAPKKLMPQHRRMLYHEFRDAGNRLVTCRPDAAALLSIPHPSGDAAKATALAIHFEIDRSTEGVAQCQTKLPGYAALVEQRAHARYWSDPRIAYRIFWVVPSRERIETLCAAFREVPVATHFRFTTFADCVPGRILTQPVWRDLSGSLKTLYHQPSSTLPL